MSTLAFRYEPQTFEDLLGQEEAISTLTAQVKQDGLLPLLLSGPCGTGKTTLARVFARALNCLALTRSGSPCLHCTCCQEFDTSARTWVFCEVNSALHGHKDDATYIDELARIQPAFSGRRRVVLLDEAHALSRPAQDALLNVFETPGVAAFVLATTEPHRVAPALRSRCLSVRTKLVSTESMIGYGREICKREHISFEPEGLALLAVASRGHVRNFVLSLDALAAQGPLTVAAVSVGQDLDWAPTVLRALRSLLTEAYPSALSDLAAWQAPPQTKAAALRDALVFVVHRAFMKGSITDGAAAFLTAPQSVIDELASLIEARAATAGKVPTEYALALGTFWSNCAPATHDEGDLHLQLLRFSHTLHPTSAALPHLPAMPVSPPEPLARRRASLPSPVSSRRVSVNERGAFLTAADVQGEYRAATLLGQAYGLCFNVRLLLRFADYGVRDLRGGLSILSELTHELGLRLRDWAGDDSFRFHWLAQHEMRADLAPAAILLMHIPIDAQQRARDWIAAFLPPKEGELVSPLGTDIWRAPNATGRATILHWSLIRECWRAVNPDIVQHDSVSGRRRPLIDLLGVPLQGRHPAGVLPARVRRFSTSQTLGPGVWRKASGDRFGFLSALGDHAWRTLDSGWELDEYQDRRAEADRRARQLGEITAQWPAGESALQDHARNEKLQAARKTWPDEPKLRPRSWTGWWL